MQNSNLAEYSAIWDSGKPAMPHHLPLILIHGLGLDHHCFDGMLPTQWASLSFRVQFRGRELSVSMDAKNTTVHLLAGLPLEIEIRGERQRLTSASVD